MIRLLIADDFPIVRKGLKEILEEKGGFRVTDDVDDGRAVLEKIRENTCDVVLMDISMPGRSGLEVLADIRRIRPDLPVLIISMHPEEDYAVRALRAGANGYVTKTAKPSELVEAVNTVVAGRKYISPTLAENLALHLDGSGDAPHKQLSDREFEVFRKLAEGRSVTDIAGELALSIKTVSTYRARILEKMNLKSNAELAIYALKNKLICE